MKYVLVQPYADGGHRFEHATVVSTHHTADAAFPALAPTPAGCSGFGIRPDTIELFVVDE